MKVAGKGCEISRPHPTYHHYYHLFYIFLFLRNYKHLKHCYHSSIKAWLTTRRFIRRQHQASYQPTYVKVVGRLWLASLNSHPQKTPIQSQFRLDVMKAIHLLGLIVTLLKGGSECIMWAWPRSFLTQAASQIYKNLEINTKFVASNYEDGVVVGIRALAMVGYLSGNFGISFNRYLLIRHINTRHYRNSVLLGIDRILETF